MGITRRGAIITNFYYGVKQYFSKLLFFLLPATLAFPISYNAQKSKCYNKNYIFVPHPLCLHVFRGRGGFSLLCPLVTQAMTIIVSQAMANHNRAMTCIS